MISKPCGVCIQLFEAKIQKVDISVPSATMQVAKKCRPGPTRFQPNSITPRNPASRKNAVRTSYVSNGPVILPANEEKKLQLVPNWYAMTSPDTTPIPKLTANIFDQK